MCWYSFAVLRLKLAEGNPSGMTNGTSAKLLKEGSRASPLLAAESMKGQQSSENALFETAPRLQEEGRPRPDCFHSDDK